MSETARRRGVHVVLICASMVFAPRVGHALSPNGHLAPATSDDSCRFFRIKANNADLSEMEIAPLLPKFEMRALRGVQMESLRGLLRRSCWAEARRLYFSVYQAPIADWIVYIDSVGRVTQDLHSEKARKRYGATDREVHGLKFVYALVLWDMKTPPAPAKWSVSGKTTLRIASDSGTVEVPMAQATVQGGTGSIPQLMIRRRVVMYERDPVLSVLVSALGKSVGIASPVMPSQTDSSVTVSIQKVGDDPGPFTMYAGSTRFGVVDNVRMELSVNRDDGEPFADTAATRPAPLKRVLLNFANAREHRFELGLVPGVTFGNPVRTFTGAQVTSESSGRLANVYAAATLNIAWFEQIVATTLGTRESWRRASIGAILGTNVLRGQPGDELIVGGVLGHVLGDGGIVVAADYMSEPELRSGHVANPRRRRLLTGFLLTI